MKTKEEILNTFNIQEGAYWAYREGLQEGYNEAISSLRNQDAIAAMQGTITILSSSRIPKEIAEQQEKLIALKKNLSYCIENFRINKA